MEAIDILIKLLLGFLAIVSTVLVAGPGIKKAFDKGSISGAIALASWIITVWVVSRIIVFVF